MDTVSPASVSLKITSTWDGRPCREDERCEVTAAWIRGHLEICFDAPLHGDPLPQDPAGELEGLWNWEVVEVFVFGEQQAQRPITYTEIEVGPAGHWLCLQLDGIRQRVASFSPSLLEVRHAGQRWAARVVIEQHHLPPTPWRVNAFAAHGPATDRRLLAAFPAPGDEPDFHRPDAAAAWSSLTAAGRDLPECVQSP